MKKILSLITAVVITLSVSAQADSAAIPKTKRSIDLSNRPNDHFLLQFGLAGWSGIPDTINKNGLSKSINAYFMFDFPFKTNPHLSMAFGPGIASDHILFTKTNVGIKDPVPEIRFTNVADTNNFKKTKLATVYLEAPVEFRYSGDPATGKGFKAAIGVKVGLLINAHTRNAKLQNSAGSTINDYVMKESSTNFFNRSRISLQGRVGFGHFTLYGSYQATPLFKDGQGPVVRPFAVGITLSGL